MSLYNQAEGGKQLGSLDVRAPIGVMISVRQGAFKDIAQGYGKLRLAVPPGIYSIRWDGAGRTAQKLVKVLEGEKTQALYDDADDTSEATAILKQIERLTSRNNASSGLIISIKKLDDGETSLIRDFKIRGSDLEDASERADLSHWIFEERTQSLSIDLGPGVYILSYKTPDRITVEQAIEVFPQRFTLALMASSRAFRPEKTRDDMRFRSREGVNPGSTRFTSVSRRDNPHRIANLIRVSGALTGLLANNTRLDPTFLNQLININEPYSQTYAMALFLSQQDDEQSESPDQRATRPRPITTLLPYLLGWSESFISSDFRCLSWNETEDYDIENPLPFSSLTVPPMLEQSWRRALLWSVETFDYGEMSPEMTRASTARISASPWVVWRSRNQRAERLSNADLSLKSAHDLAQQLNDTVKRLSHAFRASRKRGVSHKAVALPQIDFSRLSFVTRQLASDMLALDKQGDTNDINKVLEKLVLSLNAPSAMVTRQMETALEEINDAVNLEKLDQASFSTDPHKGKFGKRSSSKGLKLELVDWRPSNDPEFLALDIQLTAFKNSQPPSGPARFHLHPTFHPPLELVPWRDRRASFTCYAMGGFTLGVETMVDGILLELDLALDTRLPQWFRNR
ncbi:pYEATS domain-containing protein [Rhizobium sp. X9]|uniref:pYEATS domain-containing protein n=1 Tax=Rhizobium sp. X9 TaxID=2815360 RepID=UPI001C0D4913|nr:pYEATS domain-containing protein [Rhizobium sp. X9]